VINTGKHLPRRTFLKGMGVTIGLPLLDGMIPVSARAARAVTPPVRLAFIYVPNGIVMKDWTPKAAGKGFEFTRILKPLEPLREDLFVLSGLDEQNGNALGDGPGDHARAGAAFLTGVHCRKTEGADLRNGISADQIAALTLGSKTRFPSIELGCEDSRTVGNCDSGYSCAYTNSISWRGEATPMPPELNPRMVFERLFGTMDYSLDSETRSRRALYRSSILDSAREDTRQLAGKLGAPDRRKLDEYLSAVREIERRIQTAEKDNRQVFFDINTGVLRDPTTKPFGSSKSNFAPRLALTWSPNPSATGFFGGGNTILRGGFGIYYGPGQTEDQIQPIESNRISSTLSGGAFPQDTNAIIANFVNNPNNRSYQPRAYANEYQIPEKIYQYTFSVQQQLPYKIGLTAAFVGSEGRNLFLRSVANRILPGQTVIADGTALPNTFGVVNRTNAAGQVTAVNTIREFSIVSGTSSVQNPYAEVDYKTSGGHDNYKALQLSLARRLDSGVTLNGQYTFGRSFGNTAGSNEARTAANNARALTDFDYDNGYNNFDVRHTFNLSAIYDLPFGKGKRYELSGIANTILGDWEVGAIANARSGLPLEVGIVRPDIVIQCRATNGCVVPTGAGGATTTFANGFVAQLPGTINAANPLPPGFIAVVNTPSGGASRNVRRPDFIPGVNPFQSNDRLILNPAAFTTPQPGTFGNVPRNALRGPNFRQFDIIFNKRIRFTETTNLEFRTEIFNLFNRANFDIPGSRLNLALPTVSLANGVYTVSTSNALQPGQPYTQGASGGTFGLLRQTVVRDVGLGTSRQIQFALRFNF